MISFTCLLGVLPEARCAMKCCTSTVISTLNFTVLPTGAQEISLDQFIIKCKKVKQSQYSSGQALRVPGG